MNKAVIKLPGLRNYFMKEAYNVLRTNVQFCGQDVKVIAITSCDENEGKTVVSMNLGKCLAELGKRVLYVDADLRKSVVMGRNTNVRNAQGLSEIISGLQSFDDVVFSTQFPGFDIVFSGKYPPNPVELLNSKYFKMIIENAKELYDYIVIDTPPLGRVIDAAVIASLCDSSIVVIGNTRNKCSKIQEVVDQLKKSGSNVLGVIMNRADKHRKLYYRQKKSYYYYKKY